MSQTIYWFADFGRAQLLHAKSYSWCPMKAIGDGKDLLAVEGKRDATFLLSLFRQWGIHVELLPAAQGTIPTIRIAVCYGGHYDGSILDLKRKPPPADATHYVFDDSDQRKLFFYQLQDDGNYHFEKEVPYEAEREEEPKT